MTQVTFRSPPAASGATSEVQVDSNNPLPVTIVSGGGAGSNVNLVQVDGAAIALGQTTKSASLPVTVASDQTIAATQSGTWNIGTVTTLTGITPAFGATGSNVPASGGYQGVRATTANPTAASDGQMVGAQGDKEGRVAVVPYSVRDLATQQKTTISNTTSETTIVTAVASTFLDVLSFNFSNTGATATQVDIRDTTGGNVVATFMVPAGDMRGQTYTLPFKQTSVNTNWTAKCASATTALEVTVQVVKNI